MGRRTCIVIIEHNEDGHQAGHRDHGGLPYPKSWKFLSSARSSPPPSFGAKIRTDFISGMGKIADKFVIILSIDKVLSVEEIARLAEIMGGR